MFGHYFIKRLLLIPTCANLKVKESYASLIIRSFKSYESNDDCEHSSVVGYLVNSCQLQRETALFVSQKLQFKTHQGPESVLNLFRNNGFTDSQISKLVRTNPKLLLADAENTLLPKFEFLRSIGATSSDLSVILVKDRSFLTRSLHLYIIPLYTFLKSVLVDDEKVLKALNRVSSALHNGCSKTIATNISVLKEHGVPQSSIAVLIMNYPSVASLNTEKLVGYVDKLVKIGFDPQKYIFIEALTVFYRIKCETLEQKVEVYKKWGLSEDEIWSAFRKHTGFMKLSEKRIMSTMDFLVNKMGWQPGDVAKFPTAMCYSFEKRIFPRCSVIRVLRLKGKIKQVTLSSVLISNEKLFLDKFVFKFQDQVPQLLNIYQRKTDLLQLGLGFEETSG